jgi:cytochrome c-type biogenesis protein CcmH/NrfG
MRNLAAFALTALMTTPTLFAQSGVPTESMGSHLKTPEEKALNEYARGVKDKQKAEQEQDHDKKMKLYMRAKDEFSKSVGYQGHYDGYLALGQVYLALGQKESALDACSHAQAMKPNSEEAKSCIGEARKKPESSEAKPAGGQ